MTSNVARPDRRAFLGAAAATMAAAAGSGAADEKEPVRVLVVGTGARGSDLIRALTTIEGVDLAGVCDDYEPHQAQGLKYAGPRAKAFADYRQALDRLRPRAVVVAVPPALHVPIALDALDAGAAVFCEKVLGTRLDEARRLARRVAEGRRVFQVGLQRRANAVYQQAAALVRAGVIGQVTAVRAQWHRHNNWRRPVPVPRGDARWAALERRLNWRLYRDTSAGLMAELGSHQIDVANWLLGAPPRRVLATGGIDYWRDGREVFDNIACVYEYELPPPPGPASGRPYTVRVTYSALCNNAFEGASELVMGTRGTLLLTPTRGLLYREPADDDAGRPVAEGPGATADREASVLAAGKTLKLSDSPWAHRGVPTEIDAPADDDTRAQLVSFLDHVRRGDPRTLVDAEAGLINTASVLIANQAAESGRPVPFPADPGAPDDAPA